MHSGVSSKSQLLDSLKGYLNNKTRLQPIIGLGSIVECVNVGTQNREALYMCEVCVRRLSKADMRNHILGSLHRYNYIKIWHPHLASKWQETSDLSKLAWPLMEMAKVLEGKEGPGNIRLFEVEDAVYWKMATQSENDVLILINSIRDGRGDPESSSEVIGLHYPIQSQRTVFPQWSKWRSKKSAPTNTSPPLTHAHVAPSVQSEVQNIPTSQWEGTQTSPEPSVKTNSFLDDYTGSKPLIGLFRVVEYRSEDGCSHCFLCHCCRIRATTQDITDHLTSSSHLSNYLMETYPEKVEVILADTDNCQLLESLAWEVEQEEGRGGLKVVNAPESVCMLLTGKSYHWCKKMLCSEWAQTNIQKKNTAAQVPSVNETSVGGAPQKCTEMLSKEEKRETTKRKRKVSDPVFNVSLPLRKASVLLTRSSFSTDSLPVSSASSSPDLDVVPTELQPDLESENTDARQFIPKRNFTVTVFKDMDSYVSAYSTQPDDITGGTDHKVHGQYGSPHGSPERSSEMFCKKWRNEDMQTQTEGLLPAVSHNQDWSSYNYRHNEECWTEEPYYSTSESQVGTRGEESREEQYGHMRFDAVQHYYLQPHQHQHWAWDNTIGWYWAS